MKETIASFVITLHLAMGMTPPRRDQALFYALVWLGVGVAFLLTLVLFGWLAERLLR